MVWRLNFFYIKWEERSGYGCRFKYHTISNGSAPTHLLYLPNHTSLTPLYNTAMNETQPMRTILFFHPLLLITQHRKYLQKHELTDVKSECTERGGKQSLFATNYEASVTLEENQLSYSLFRYEANEEI